MLKRTTIIISKVRAIQRLPFGYLKPSSGLFNCTQKAAFSSVWQKSFHQQKNINYLRKCTFASLPAHSKMAMPALSPTMEQGNIVKWNFKEGEKVEAGDQICDVETDKATVAFEVQDEGYVAKILVPEGTKGVKVGTPIVILVDSQDAVKSFKDYKDDAPSQQAEGESKSQTSTDKPKEEPKQETKQTQQQPSPKGQKVTTKGYEGDHHHTENFKGVPRKNVSINFGHRSHGQGTDAQQSSGGRVLASPLARKLAAQKGIDLSQVSGSGPNGRVLKHDVEGYTPKPAEKAATSEKAAPSKTPKAQPAAAPSVANPYVDTPLTDSRKALAAQFVESKATIPHYYVGIDINVNEALALCDTLNKSTKTPISFNDFIIKAAAKACQDNPDVNSHWNGKTIRKYKNVDICFPVTVGSEQINTVIPAANLKGLAEIAFTTTLLADKAKGGALQDHEREGATFTVLNVGAQTLTRLTSVLIPPQSALVSVGSVLKKVIPEGEGFKEVNVLNAMLTGDHRVVDGAAAARWLQSFKGYIEKPHTLLL